jgi:hypothetical protein
MFAKKSTTADADDGEETDSGGEVQEEETTGSKVGIIHYLNLYVVTKI